MTSFIHDPQAVLDYHFVWGNWLEAGEILTSHTITVSSSDLVADSSRIVDGQVTVGGVTYDPYTVVEVWLSGGVSNTRYQVTCHIVTSDNREDDRSITISCEQR